MFQIDEILVEPHRKLILIFLILQLKIDCREFKSQTWDVDRKSSCLSRLDSFVRVDVDAGSR